MRIDDLDTPAVVIDLDIVGDNISRMQNHLSANEIKCRPHIKTHKIPALAHMQLRAGAVGVMCQKISEAEVMADAGIEDIYVGFNIVGKAKLERLMMLARRVKLTVVADSDYVVLGLSEAARAFAAPVSVLVECDTGRTRSGVQTPEQAVKLAESIESAAGLQFKGLLCFKGGVPDIDHVVFMGEFFREVIERLQGKGIRVDTVSAGGTVDAWTAWPKHKPFGVTENRPGVYVYNDRVKKHAGVCTLEQCAMRVICTVVSRPIAERAVVDVGTKTLTDAGWRLNIGFGEVIEYPDATVPMLFEEHGVVDVRQCRRKPAIGERLTLVPNYVNGVSSIVDVVHAVRDGRVEARWAVLARGKTS